MRFEKETMLVSGDAKLLCDEDSSEFRLGGGFDRICRENGYASGRQAANDLHLYHLTVPEALSVVRKIKRDCRD